MRKDDCFQLGHVSRTHGLKGEVVAVFDTDRPEAYIELESVFLDIRGELVPFFISALAQNSKGHFILHFEDYTSEEEAATLINRELFLPLEWLPALSGKQFYFHEVIGFTITDKNLGLLGTCTEVNDYTAQPLFVIKQVEREQPLLVPAVDDFIVSVNRDKKEIVVDCPEGLVE